MVARECADHQPGTHHDHGDNSHDVEQRIDRFEGRADSSERVPGPLTGSSGFVSHRTIGYRDALRVSCSSIKRATRLSAALKSVASVTTMS